MQPDVVDMPDVAEPVGPLKEPSSGLRSFWSHPKGLYPLFFTEMWERFSFYLMLALLALYMKDYLNFSTEYGSDVTTWYLSLVYFTPFIGGLIADRLTGYARAIVLGGLLMMAGHITLAFDSRESAHHVFLFTALGLLIAGNGLFKPNISTLVGNLYAKEDSRRDQGFTIFYMGINLGAFLSPLAANALREKGPSVVRGLTGWTVSDDAGWHIAFGSAGIGMVLSLITFTAFRRRFSPAEAVRGPAWPVPESESTRAAGESTVQGDRALRIGQWFNMVTVTLAMAWLLVGPAVVRPEWPEAIRSVALWPTNMVNFIAVWLTLEVLTVLIFLSGGDLVSANAAKLKAVFIIVALFWMAFHQSAVTLPYFADDHTQRMVSVPGVGRVELGAEAFNAINPFFILLFSPLMVLLWSWLGRRGREPSSVTKMILAMFVTGLAFVVMVGAGKAGGDTGRVGPLWLVGFYAVLTVAELWLSPIGLSLTSKLAPAKYRGLWMGFWFMATAVGNKLVHVIGQYWGKIPPSQLFLILVITSVGAAFVLDYILINLRRFGPPSSDA
jgi:POT family proton-dependent oligopeptide transporter